MSNGLEFSFDRAVPAQALLELMLQTGWGKGRHVNGLETMLAGSSIVLSVWNGDRLVGFARALTDGVYRALIEDVIVDESYRARGIGSEIVRMLIDRLSHVEHVYLFTGESLERYYERFGFTLTPYPSMRLLPGEQ
jgi:GNAT superfamily N-acetyltransferase